jgi:hypothetical protein
MLEREREFIVLRQRFDITDARARGQLAARACALDISKRSDREERCGSGEYICPSLSTSDLMGVTDVLVVLDVSKKAFDRVTEEDPSDTADSRSGAFGFA